MCRGYPWPAVRQLCIAQLLAVMAGYVERSGVPPPTPSDEEPFLARYRQLVLLLSLFPHPPFTLQRLCELLTSPLAHYASTSSFMLAVSKCVLGISAEEADGLEEDSDDAEEEEGMEDEVEAADAQRPTGVGSALDFLSKALPHSIYPAAAHPMDSTAPPPGSLEAEEDAHMEPAD